MIIEKYLDFFNNGILYIYFQLNTCTYINNKAQEKLQSWWLYPWKIAGYYKILIKQLEGK